MARVMMICPKPGSAESVYSGFDAEESADLSGLIVKLVDCPHCKKRHTVEAAHFEGKAPPRNYWHGLDCDRDGAAEVGIIIAEVAVIEGHLANLLRCVIGIDEFAAGRLLGQFQSILDRVKAIEDLASERIKWEETPGPSKIELSRILEIIAQIKSAITIRNKFGHSFYGAGATSDGSGDGFNITPYQFDTRRKNPKPSEFLTFADIVRIRQTVRKAQLALSDYLHTGDRLSKVPV